MTAPEVLNAFIATAERIYPDRRVSAPPADFVMLAGPEPCEVCGTAVFPARWKDGAVVLWHIGWEYRKHKARLDRHRPKLCRSARRRGIRLDGRLLRVTTGGDDEHR